jgi:hypothetical protein
VEINDSQLELIERAITKLVALRSTSTMAKADQWKMISLTSHLNRRRDFVELAFGAAAQYFLDLFEPDASEDELRRSVKAFVAGMAFGTAAGILASEDPGVV